MGETIMLLAITFAAIICQCGSVQPNRARQVGSQPPDVQIVKEIHELASRHGGTVSQSYNLAEGHKEWRLDLSCTRITPKDMEQLIKLMKHSRSWLRQISVRKTEMGDELIGVLDLCKPTYKESDEPINFSEGLIELDISFTHISTRGITRLLKIHRDLFWVDLSGLPVDAQCLALLDTMPCLSSLILEQTCLDAPAALRLRVLKLRKLDIGNSSVDDQFVRDLAGTRKADMQKERLVAELEDLRLCGTKATDGALEHIQMFRHLRRLDLSRTSISDEKKVHALIQALVQLRELRLIDTSLSDEAKARLADRWPKIVIVK
jgi:hypothetical protein